MPIVLDGQGRLDIVDQIANADAEAIRDEPQGPQGRQHSAILDRGEMALCEGRRELGLREPARTSQAPDPLPHLDAARSEGPGGFRVQKLINT